MKTRLLIAIMFLALSCGREEIKFEAPRFNTSEIREFEIITGEQLWGGMSKIFKYGDIIAVVSYENGNPSTWLHLFNLDGTILSNMLTMGRGPLDAVYIKDAYLSDNMLYMFDYSDRKMISVDMSKVRDDGYAVLDSYKISGNGRLNYYAKTSNGSILCKYDPRMDGQTDSLGRMSLYSSCGDLISMWNESPFSSKEPSVRWYLESPASRQAMSEDGDKFVIATSTGAVLETFSLSHNKIKQIVTKYFVKPVIEKSGMNVSFGEKSIAGFGDICAKNKYLYAVYDGENYLSDSVLKFKNIAVFDWKGNALKEIRTNFRIESICTEDEKTFYAVINDKERRAYIAKLTL